MTETELQAVIDGTRHLKLIQETPDPPEALATIPSLTLSDLDKDSRLIPLAISAEQACQILYHDLFTNGIVYLDVGFNLHTLPQELLAYVPLFGKSLLKIGTEREDFVKLSQRIDRKTGGIWPSSFSSIKRKSDDGTAWLFLRSKATMTQTDDLLDILRDILLTVKLDNPDRFKQMVLETKARTEAALIPGGHGVVDTRLRAKFNEADWADEEMGGVSYLFFLRQLTEDVENDWPSVLAKLEKIRHLLLNRHSMLCNVTLDGSNWQQFQPRLSNFLSALPGGPATLIEWNPHYSPYSEGLTIPAKVNYVGKGANLYRLGYQLHGSHLVVTNYLRTTWLWEKIRMQGGAYGGMCSFNANSGVFSFLSYRDPNLLETLANYDLTSEFLRQVDLDKDKITKSIIGAIGQLDAYQLPDAKGFTSMIRHLIGLSDDIRQQRRDEVLGTTLADFRAFADVLEQVNQQGVVVVLGAQEAIEAANAEQDHGLRIQKVM
jgi:Zn-dependent M16 (insulinase) family peptidase